MSGGGTKTYKHPHIPWGGRMRSSLKLSKSAKGCLNCYDNPRFAIRHTKTAGSIVETYLKSYNSAL